MGIDVLDDHLEGRSSSAAKKADADFKIEFARRNSRFSCSSSLTLAAINLVLTDPIPEPSPQRCNAEMSDSPKGLAFP